MYNKFVAQCLEECIEEVVWEPRVHNNLEYYSAVKWLNNKHLINMLGNY